MKTTLYTLVLASFFSLNAMACPGSPNCPMHEGDMPKEKRAEMAAVHTQMAECLKSEKPMEECHKIMAEHMGGGSMGEHACAHGDGNKSCPMHKEVKKEKSKK